MKRVMLDGLTVTNVEVVPDDETDGLIVPDDCWVGPGCIWNGDSDAPTFSAPPVDEATNQQEPE